MKKTSVIVLLAVLVVIVLLIGRFNFSEADFSMSNPAWNGMTQFSGNGTVNYLYAISDLSGVGENNTVLIVGPTLNYTPEESAQARMFAERGGTIIVMDDFGTSNTLLNYMESPITLHQAPVCDYENYYKRPSFPVIVDIKNTSVTTGVSSLVLNHPASLNISGNAIILANTSRLSWVDENANILIDGNENFNASPIIARAKYGKGEVIVVSDPDVIVNVMVDQGENSVFASNIMKKGTVYLDISHGQKIPPLESIFFILKNDLVAQLLCSLLIMLTGYVVYRRASIKKAILGPEPEMQEPASKKRSIVDFIKAKLPAKESDIKELDKKL
ncbi:DUF4350 domain-containing protein [Methanocella sp. MCL-LM]|uniref:DUF4350 domain-containing protein n=1 Tax=Methanocella sp. MCL-LM TaxID=3412035 RepID=UPI003C7521EF